MKLVILLFAVFLGFGATLKQSTADVEALKVQKELEAYKAYPNMLPTVEIVPNSVK